MVRTPRYDEAVLKALGRGTRFRSCREIHRDLERVHPAGAPRPSLSTIYRTVHRMSQEGVLDTVRSPEGERLYRRCRTPAHHHLFCRSCKRVEEIAQSDELLVLVQRIKDTSGFGEIEHTFELTGLCPRCR